MAYNNKGGTAAYEASPCHERFQRRKRPAPTTPGGNGDDANKPGEMASQHHESKGAKSNRNNIMELPIPKYTPPHARQPGVADKTASSERGLLLDLSSPLSIDNDNGDDALASPGKPLRERRSQHSVSAGHPLRESSSNLSGRHQINGVDAQNLYPPTACVFVANLCERKDDTALEAGIYREFTKYGKCWVKIRRDGHNMPFAFVQYTTNEEAAEALVKGRGALIHGRPCRTEKTKANRTYVVQRKDLGSITTHEARTLLLPFGSLSRCELIDDENRELLSFPPTVLVEFKMFDATRDLHTAFRQNTVYNVSAFDMKKNSPVSHINNDEVYLTTYERDRCTIYVGDLPVTATSDGLEDLFGRVGEIVNISIVQKSINMLASSRGSAGPVRTMAFIEYTESDMAEVAISRFDGTLYKGAYLRVQRKLSHPNDPSFRPDTMTLRPSREKLASRHSRDKLAPVSKNPTKEAQQLPCTKYLKSIEPLSPPPKTLRPPKAGLYRPLAKPDPPVLPSREWVGLEAGYEKSPGANTGRHHQALNDADYASPTAHGSEAGGSATGGFGAVGPATGVFDAGMAMTPQAAHQISSGLMDSPWGYHHTHLPSMMSPTWDPYSPNTPNHLPRNFNPGAHGLDSSAFGGPAFGGNPALHGASAFTGYHAYTGNPTFPGNAAFTGGIAYTGGSAFMNDSAFTSGSAFPGGHALYSGPPFIGGSAFHAGSAFNGGMAAPGGFAFTDGATPGRTSTGPDATSPVPSRVSSADSTSASGKKAQGQRGGPGHGYSGPIQIDSDDEEKDPKALV